MFFDRQIRFQKAAAGISGDRHEHDPVVHVAQIGIESQFQLTSDLALLLPKLRGECVEDRGLDATVQIVDVDLLHALAQARPLALEPGYGGIVIPAQLAEILLQGSDKPAVHAFTQLDPVEDRSELLEQHLLAYIGFPAVLLRVAAPVIDILLLLDVADEQAAAMAALDHPGEEEVLLDAADAGGVTSVEHALNAFP